MNHAFFRLNRFSLQGLLRSEYKDILLPFWIKQLCNFRVTLREINRQPDFFQSVNLIRAAFGRHQTEKFKQFRVEECLCPSRYHSCVRVAAF